MYCSVFNDIVLYSLRFFFTVLDTKKLPFKMRALHVEYSEVRIKVLYGTRQEKTFNTIRISHTNLQM